MYMKLQVKLKNCYGIGLFEQEFDFSKTNTYLIYAQNGIFKTSFAKTLKDIIKQKDTKDIIIPNRPNMREVTIDNNPLSKEKLLVVDSFVEDYDSTKSVTTFMASKELKKQYDEIITSLDKDKKELLKKLKNLTGSSDCEKELLKIFENQSTFYEIISQHLNEITKAKQEYQFKYHDIFDDKGVVKDFLDKNITLLQEYIDKYNELLSQSTIFKNTEKGSFGTNQVNSLADSLKDDKFFMANHIIQIGDEKIDSYEKLDNLIKNEIDKVMNNEEILKKFTSIEKQIKNEALRNFKEAIHNDKSLLLELIDYENFRKKVFLSFLNRFSNEIAVLVKNYRDKKIEIDKIIQKARGEQDKWKNIVELFNNRFFVPFKVAIKNQEEVLLKEEVAQFVFEFNDGETQNVDSKQLKEVLSMGEKRALYILQILFDIEAIKERNSNVVLVFDDISDSFDYKNKYAIIEYLNDINRLNNFKSIVMTHNFDFYRTLGSRLNLSRENIFMAVKESQSRKITLSRGQYLNAIIKALKDNLSKNDKKAFITLIPFVRNLIEYTKGEQDTDYLTLTSCLHIKNDTDSITPNSVVSIFNSILNLQIQMEVNETQQNIKEVIYVEANNISNENNLDSILLENKVLLAIAIRLKAEEFMIKQFEPNIDSINRNQTRELFDKIKDQLDEQQKIILQQVLMVTPEHIHINSFMYEPILDTSVEHLIYLYRDILKLSSGTKFKNIKDAE